MRAGFYHYYCLTSFFPTLFPFFFSSFFLIETIKKNPRDCNNQALQNLLNSHSLKDLLAEKEPIWKDSMFRLLLLPDSIFHPLIPKVPSTMLYTSPCAINPGDSDEGVHKGPNHKPGSVGLDPDFAMEELCNFGQGFQPLYLLPCV